MARLFSIDIPFRDEHYTALVSVKERGHDICCTVRYVEKNIRHILSGDKLIFSLHEGLKEPRNLPNELAESLFISTTNAIADHMACQA